MRWVMISRLLGLIGLGFVGLGSALAGHRSHPRELPYGPFISHCNVPNTVALTFDDGPYIYTDHVLDLLAQYGGRATFFVNGVNGDRGAVDDPATAWPDTLRRINASGHQIGAHGWSHADLDAADAAEREFEVAELERALADVLLGWYPAYFRPPYGLCDEACRDLLARRGYHVVLWDVDTKDYANDTPALIRGPMDFFDAVLAAGPAAADSSYLVLNHDIHEQTAHVLVEHMLETLSERGYRAVTVGECLGDPPENWYRQE